MIKSFKAYSILIYLLLFLIFDTNADVNDLLNQLDQYLELRETYFQKRINQIDVLKEELKNEFSNEKKYDLNRRITEKYLPYNADSALFYATKGKEYALLLKDDLKLIESKLILAQAYILVGLYHESVGILSEFEESTLPQPFQVQFYSINAVLYNTLSSLRNTSTIRNSYKEKWFYYEKGLMNALPENDLGHLLAKAEIDKEVGKFEEAISILEGILKGVQKKDRVYASTAYTLADTYGRNGNFEKKLAYLALSAQSDIMNGVKEHTALRALSLELYKNGKIDRAYHYVKVALDDAVESNAQLRRYEVLEILPLIDQTYQENRDKARLYIMIFTLVSIIFSIILLSGLVVIYKQKGKLETSNTKVNEVNSMLSSLNKELKESKKEIEEANYQLQSINNIQEESIARYLKLCSTYIGKLDDYRRQLLRKGNKSNKEDLLKVLKSKDVVDQELKIFYKDFDQSFLKLYPNFVSDYNNLMIEEAQITLKKNELLNTELRVFALVRLGIEESTQIAEFLRYSITTIYNYRTKARNNAKDGRDNFEKRLMEIK